MSLPLSAVNCPAVKSPQSNVSWSDDPVVKRDAIKERIWVKLIFGSISNFSFASNTDSKNQIQTRPKIKFFQVLSPNLIFEKSTTDQQHDRGRKKFASKSKSYK